MSVISDRSSFVPFVSNGAGKSKALNGQRLVKVIYKSRGDTKAKLPNVCASVPVLIDEEIAGNINALMPHIRSLVANAQDGIAKERYEAGAATIGNEEISVAACIAYLDAESSGSRLSGDDIRLWFTNELQDVLMLAIAEKMNVSDTPSDEEAKKIEQALAVYRDKLASLAGGKTAFSEQVCDRLLNVLPLVDENDPMVQRLSKRLSDMKLAHNDVLFAL